ncbi:MAG: HEAT repeat domain-containing protein [Verrucomicrobiales bacterium]|nr:HEAT repeat domain-containing protein [Verrucomicrobiales bacterium]
MSAGETGGLRAGTRRRRVFGGLVTGLLVAVAGALCWSQWSSPAEREANRWVRDFLRVRAADTARLPDWPLSYEGQRVMVRSFTRPESAWLRAWDRFRRRMPPSMRVVLPRIPGARDRAITLGPALIEMPKMPAIRMALLEAALDPRGANRAFAVQFAGADLPVPKTLLPLLERLAEDADPAVRSQVALAVAGMRPGDPEVERLLGRLQADQVSSVREAARHRPVEPGDLE